MDRLRRIWRRLSRREGLWPRLVMLAACALVTGMYLTNHDMGGDDRSPRGDGVYRPVLARGDGHMLYLMARSTALDLDWTFDNDLRRFGDPWNEPRTKTGRKAIIHPIGVPLVWTPLIWIAQAGAVVANVFGADIPLHGYTPWHQRIVFLSSLLAACGAVLLGRRIARAAIGGGWAPTYAAVAILLGTSLTYYATYMPSYSHAIDAFACAAFLAYWALTVGRDDKRRWLVLGLLLGFAMLVRTQEVAMGIVVAIEVVVRLVQTRRWQWLAGGAAVLAIAIVVFIPQLVEWHVVFGKVTELPQGAKYTRFEAPMIGELLYSARNGWFTTTPLAYAGVIGLFLLPRRSRLIAAGLLAAVAMQVYLNSTILDWWGSAAFGQRRMCNVTLPIVVGLAALIWRCGHLARRLPRPASHALCVAILGVFVVWNFGSISRLRGGKPAPSELDASCCARWPFARHVYDRYGSPFEFPANALFALRHHVPLSRWHLMHGGYPMQPSLGVLRGTGFYDTRGHWGLAEPYLVGAWSAVQNDGGRRFRRTKGDATLLVPNLMPDAQRITLSLQGTGYVELSWNGDVVATAWLVPGVWMPVSFELRKPALHTNELSIHAPDVAISELDFEFVH